MGFNKLHDSRMELNTNRSIRRSAFTVIEMLVVISIIGLMIALLIPAIQAAREAARRMNCVANLKQFGVALNSYQSSIGLLPSSSSGKRGFSVHAMILSNLENVQLYNSINFSLSNVSQTNKTVYMTQLSAFCCPSDRFSFKPGGWASYACNTGYAYQVDKKFNGTFAKSPETSSLASVSDGTSSTAMMSEWVQGSGRISRLFGRIRGCLT